MVEPPMRLALASTAAEVAGFGVVPWNLLVTGVAGGGVVNHACRDSLDLGAQLARRAMLALIADTDEFVATNEKGFFGHLSTSCCREY